MQSGNIAAQLAVAVVQIIHLHLEWADWQKKKVDVCL